MLKRRAQATLWQQERQINRNRITLKNIHSFCYGFVLANFESFSTIWKLGFSLLEKCNAFRYSYGFLLPTNFLFWWPSCLGVFCLLPTEASNQFGQKCNREKASGCFVYRQPVCRSISEERLTQPPTLTSPQHGPNAVDKLIFWNQGEQT